MLWYNVTKGSAYAVIDGEPNITDSYKDNTRTITCEPVRFFIDEGRPKNINDTFRVSNQGVNFFTLREGSIKKGFTTFNNIQPVRTSPITINASAIISQSYEYDGETEKFIVPQVLAVYSNDTIISIKGKSSNRNEVVYNLEEGTIEISRTV